MSDVDRCATSTEDEREAAVTAAAGAVRRGELVVIPTDTVYGIAADAFSHDSVKALLEAKGRGRDMPPPVLVSAATTLDALTANDQIAFRYTSPNPNGSLADVAGICDDTGLVLGMMPHPENHVIPRQHPQYVRGHRFGLANALFDAGVAHAANL